MKKSLDIILPVYNEQSILKQSVSIICEFITNNLTSYDTNIIIVDNGSTDSTFEIANQLTKSHNNIKAKKIKTKGRGIALKTAWFESSSDLLLYMDIDLSTDLSSLKPLIYEIDFNNFDIAIGSRLLKNSVVSNRKFLRTLTSKTYSFLTRFLFLSKIHDFQCGFKIINKHASKTLLPKIKDSGWFFDTELLLLAEKEKFKIKEIPVNWTDDRDSKVNVIKTIIEDIKGLIRMRIWGL
ncbi:MAG: glycosyltransferase [Dehalococcoidia bacterium]